MRETACRHGNGYGAEQQADHGRQREESFGSICRCVSTLAAFFGAAQPQRVRQLVLDRVVESADRLVFAGNQQGVTDTAADTDERRCVEVGDIHQQRWRERRKTDGLIGAIGNHGGYAQLGFADRKCIADVRADPCEQCAVRPQLARPGNPVRFPLLAEQRIGNTHHAAQGIVVGNR